MTPEETAIVSANPTTSDTKPESSGSAAPRDEFDPLGWEVPVICKDCGKGFKIPYRHFQSGLVFHCPHCHGSFVPKANMYRAVRDTFETFYSRRKRNREEFIRKGGDESGFRRQQQRELEEFHKTLERLAYEMRPAGKMVRPKGLRSMFT